jgi:hypothetical protein
LWARPILHIAVVLISLAVPLCCPSASLGGLPRDQHFVCNTGYSPAVCHVQVQQLAAHLLHYGEQLPRDWTWVLVRSQDWHVILLSLAIDPESPAFTVLEQRQTFLKEALLAPDAYSGAELLRTFKVPLDRILDVAITHELGRVNTN